jgi:1-phosphatidylinositol-4-phosphate 5-kinase
MASPVANDLQGIIDLSHSQENHSNAASRTNSAGLRVGELTLPNGDIYSGTLSREMRIPEGTGRYIWSGSCCVYEGEWRRGMRHGQGKTLWPSGATYEGEYSAGYMDGEGTYVGPDGASSYKGQWKLNRKHGLGLQMYPSGDMYQGSWIQGQMEGHGRYTWANGNTYVGTMKNGLMSGQGVLTWNTGDSFQGNWLDGMMHGYGLYTWEDSGYYLGTWTRGLKDGTGTFYPKRCRVPTAHKLYIDDLRKRGVLPDISTILQQSSSFDTKADADQESAGANLHSRNLSFGRLPSKKPSLQRRWSIGVAIEKIIGQESSADCETQGCEDMAGSDFPILEREYAQGVLISEVVLNKSSDSSKKLKRRQSKMMRDIKRPGEAIIKGHRSYDLMLCLQLGIR